MITRYSLYAAASVGLTDQIIEDVLLRLCKNKEIPSQVHEFIVTHTSSYGKAKVVLKNNQYFIEASDRQTMDKLIAIDAISKGILDAAKE